MYYSDMHVTMRMDDDEYPFTLILFPEYGLLAKTRHLYFSETRDGTLVSVQEWTPGSWERVKWAHPGLCGQVFIEVGPYGHRLCLTMRDGTIRAIAVTICPRKAAIPDIWWSAIRKDFEGLFSR